MKIRTGFVSNSSSSSFLVIYVDSKDFDRFSNFEHTKDLLEDLSKSNETKVKDFVTCLIAEDLIGRFYVFTSSWRDPRDITQSFNDIQTLVTFSGASDEEYLELYQEISDHGWDMLNEHRDDMVGDFYKSDWYKSYADSLDAIRDKIEEVSDRLAVAIITGLKEKGLNTASTQYEDHDDYGSYMEHNFMPLISMDPDNKITVITINNH